MFFHQPCKLQLGAARLLKDEVVAGNFYEVHGSRERRLNFDPILIAELVSAADFSDDDRAVIRKFPDCLIFSPRHPPFANDAGLLAAGYSEEYNCRGACKEQTPVSGKNNSHHGEVIVARDFHVE